MFGRRGLQPAHRVSPVSKDYERLCATSEALVFAAMTRLLARRLAASVAPRPAG
jgi:hypothetical protein